MCGAGWGAVGPPPARGGGLGLWFLMGLRALLTALLLVLRPRSPGLVGHTHTQAWSPLVPLKWLISPGQLWPAPLHNPSVIEGGQAGGKGVSPAESFRK